MSHLKRILVVIVFVLFVCLAMTLVFFGVPFLAGFLGMFLVPTLGRAIGICPSPRHYLWMWLVAFVLTGFTLHYLERRKRFMTKALDRIGARLGIQRRESKQR